MSSVARVVNRGEAFDDKECRNKWKWEWTSQVIELKIGGEDFKERIGARIRKIDVGGQAWCVICDHQINYAKRGFTALSDHVQTKKHIASVKALSGNQRLPGSKSTKDGLYGMDPVYKDAAETPPEPLDPLTSLPDRIANMEAMSLAFAAENNMSMATVPKLIQFAKAMSRDKLALEGIKLGDKQTASYKMVYGLAASLEESLLEELRDSFFSLNLDEATSKTNKRVLAVLVSHFSKSSGRVLVHHLAAISLEKVSAQAMFEKLEDLFAKLDLPWENLVSVLMDSCSVMRGAKGGLEALIRKNKAPQLLDIDGDSCHHVHNASKQFCMPFGHHVEDLLGHLYTDFKWSVEQKERLWDLCIILGITPTTPERYVPHRWLSVLDVSMDTLRLLDAYLLFYYSFLGEKDQSVYEDYKEEILKRHDVSDQGREQIGKIQTGLQKKWSSFTKEGKHRKLMVVNKLFQYKSKTLLILHLYVAVLPELKKYVLFFQRKETAVHLLHSKQHELFKSLCSNFLTPECLQNKLHKIDVTAAEHQLDNSSVFIGTECTAILRSKGGSYLKKDFFVQVKEAYTRCAKTLQNKMPMNNDTLKICAALDPEVRQTKTCLTYLLKAASLTNFVVVEHADAFDSEVRKYNTISLRMSSDVPIDVFWNTIDQMIFPNLTKVAKALLTAFHGPLVESSFSAMGDLLDAKSGHMDMNTYSALQTVRYSLNSDKKTAVEMFAKNDPVKEPVNGRLCTLMRSAWKGRKERQEAKKAASDDRREALGANCENIATTTTKKADKRMRTEEAQQAKEQHLIAITGAAEEPVNKKRKGRHPTAREEEDRIDQQIERPANVTVSCDQEDNEPVVIKPKLKQGTLAGFFKS